MKQKTFTVENKKTTIKSKFSHHKLGFIVYINGDKFFNSGTENNKWTNGEFWLERARKKAEDRCFKKWLNKQTKRGVK